jgi:Concanavalin A-like lectin/glucanases superfamily
MAADVNLGIGSNAGEITLTNDGSTATDVLGDVEGYFTTDDTGQLYHTVNPTRLVDTRYGIGGTTGALASDGIYKLNDTGQTDAGQVTTTPDPTFALQLTATAPSDSGELTAYPDPTQPATSNLNYATGQTIANLALVQPGTDNTIDFYNGNAGTTQLVIDSSGYFATDPYAPTHDWQLDDGSGSTARDTAGNTPITLSGAYTWPTSTTSPLNDNTVLNLDGSTAYGTASGPGVNTTNSFTISGWANLSTGTDLSTSYGTIASQSGTEAAGFYLQYNADWQGWCLNFMQTDTANAPGLGDVPCSSTTPTTGTWYYLVGTYDATSHTAALYVNGVLASSVNDINTWAASGDLTIGAGQYDDILDNDFPGEISNIETYNYAQSAAQISETYQQAN